MSQPPDKYKKTIDEIMTAAIPNSWDRGTCPSSRAFSSRRAVGSSVFSS